MKCINFGLIKYLVMKRLIFIPLLFLCFTLFGQRTYFQDSIRVPNGADTTVYLMFFDNDPWGLSFDYKDFDDTDAVLDLGESGNTTDGSVFNRLDNASLPYTMADSTVAFEKMTYNFRYLAIKLTKNSVSGGLYMRYWVVKR